jgi:DNA-binding beta-propeller fold protein YncE
MNPAAPILLALVANAIDLPGGPPVGMDYLAFDAATGRVWVPAGNTGNVDVVDVATGKVTPLGGFPTRPSPRPGRPNMGPSSVTVADELVWVGNRGDDSLCAFDRRTLKKGACVKLPTMPDGLAYVGATHELWSTTPRDRSITIVDVRGKTPKLAGTIKIDGEPEGYAVDAAHGRFYTNLEDKDRTLAIDVQTRKVVADWPTTCGGDGPRGLALDGARHLLFVACTDGAVALDLAAGHEGKAVGRLKTGGGVDNIDYHPGRRLLYVASPKEGKLVIARVADGGALGALADAPTAKGARNPVVDGAGVAYVPSATTGQLLVVTPPAAPPANPPR